MTTSKTTSKKIVKKSEDSHDDHHSSGVVYWKLALAFIPFFFGMWLTISSWIDPTGLYEFMKNPWWGFSWATFMLILLGKDFLSPLWKSIKNKKINISTLLAISIMSAYIYSLVYMGIYYNDPNLFIQNSFFDATIEIMFIVYVGYLIEDIITSRTKKDLNAMEDLYAKEAIILRNGKEIIIHPSKIKVGDLLVVKNGMKFPVDGKVIEGFTTVDESAFTGESIPVNKEINSSVFGGSLSEGNYVIIKATHTESDSAISQIIAGIKKTRQQNTKTAKLSENLSKFVIPLVLIISTIGFIIWGIAGADWTKAFEVWITTLIVTCPMVFVLLTPTATLISSSIAAKKGIVFNSPDVFEKAHKIDTIIFDKTGTLTKGNLVVRQSNFDPKYNSLVKSMEKLSTHPIAKSIERDIKAKIIDLKDVKEIPGKGIQATWMNVTYYFGSYSFVNEHCKVKDSAEVIEAKKSGATFSYLVTAKTFLGAVELRDEINESALKAIKILTKKNVDVFLFTGDNEYSAHFVGNAVGIKKENIKFDMKPFDKTEELKKLQEDGRYVAMVGDGINDSIALEQSNLGISIGSGSDLAIESSEITIQKEDLTLIVEALDITHTTLKTINYGFVVSLTWLLIAISIALSGIIIPLLGAVFMVFNDLLPVLWSLQLFRLKKEKNYEEFN